MNKFFNSTLTMLFSVISLYSQQEPEINCKPIFNNELLSFEGNTKLSDLSVNYTSTDDYFSELDTVSSYNGARSFKVTGSNDSAKTFATTSIEIPLRIKSGSKINLSAWVKTDSLEGQDGGALIRLMGYSDNKMEAPAIFLFNEKILRGTNDWTKVNIETILLKDVNKLVISGLMQGKGIVRYDYFQLNIDGLEINSKYFSGINKTPTNENFISQYIQPFGPNNYSSLDQAIKDKKLIGLGEATHGTQQIFDLKKNLIAYLITNHNVRKIALEAYYQNTEELNHYIQTGEGELKQLLANLEFWQYYTWEFFQFVEWLKEYNKTNLNKVSITGIDSQSANRSLDLLTNKFEYDKKYSDLLKQLNIDTLPLNEKFKLSNLLLNSLAKANEKKSVINNAEVLSQSYFLNQYSGLQYSYMRDSIMALNTEKIVRELPKKDKAILWAHDLHIQKKEGWTGGFLAKNFKDEYLNIGFLLGSGTFTALDKEKQYLNSNNKLKPITCNSIEYQLNDFKENILILDIKESSKNEYLQESFYKKNLQKRSIGALDNNMQFNYLGDNPELLYNFLIYIKISTASKMLNE